jgi:hypothetical protein
MEWNWIGLKSNQHYLPRQARPLPMDVAPTIHEVHQEMTPTPKEEEEEVVEAAEHPDPSLSK